MENASLAKIRVLVEIISIIRRYSLNEYRKMVDRTGLVAMFLAAQGCALFLIGAGAGAAVG